MQKAPIHKTNIADLGIPRVVIVGGGFGGLQLAKSLRNVPVQVVLLDKHNHHTFQPLLYQVATSGLESNAIVYPFRKSLNRQKNFYFRLGEVKHITPEKNTIETSIGTLTYDYLVVATGAVSNFYGMQDLAANSYPIKTIEDAIALRNKIINNFEQALLTEDQALLESLMDYVIVGGGPTGVEVAGALAELKTHVFPKDYKELDLYKMDIHLIESSPRLLNGMSEEAGREAYNFLTKMGVKVRLGQSVKSYNGREVQLSTGEVLVTQTLVWGAGVAGSPIAGLNSESIIKGNRIEVDAFSRIKGYDNIFAIGDVAAMITEETPKGHPMVAQPAIQQGKHLAQNIKRLLKQQPLQPFRYKDKGSMATIGRNKAVADIGRLKMQGFFAWLIWMFIHLLFLIGFKNKIYVFINWTISYFNYDKSSRLIIGDAGLRKE